MRCSRRYAGTGGTTSTTWTGSRSRRTLTAAHWLAAQGFRPLLVVTWDRIDPDQAAARLEAAYSAAGELAFRLDFVVAGLPSDDLTYTVPLGDGVLSVTPWAHGERRNGLRPTGRPGHLRLLDRLHRASVPRDLPRWAPLTRWTSPTRARPAREPAADVAPDADRSTTGSPPSPPTGRGW